MRSASVRIAVLVWACWWFGLFVPGHERGAIAMPGAAPGCADASLTSHCPTEGRPGSDHGSPEDDLSRQCAVCHLVAKLPAPPPADLSVPPLGLLHIRGAGTPVSLVRLECAPGFYGRGPPRSSC